MTDREKAIVMAHTGICMLEGKKLGVFYQYLNELYGRPVYTHELVTLDMKEKSKPDFLQLCKEEESVRRGRWEHLGGDEWFCTACGHVITTEGSWEQPWQKYCEECGAKMDGDGDESNE